MSNKDPQIEILEASCDGLRVFGQIREWAAAQFFVATLTSPVRPGYDRAAASGCAPIAPPRT